MSTISTEAQKHIILPQANDIRTCGQLKDCLAKCMAAKSDLLLDAVSFESGDITFVQTLVSAVKTVERLGGGVVIVNASPAFSALLNRCGLDADALGLRFRKP